MTVSPLQFFNHFSTTHSPLLSDNSRIYKQPNYSLSATVTHIYQEKIPYPKRIVPLEVNAFPKLPSVTNILTVLPETCTASKTLLSSIKNKDKEATQDAVASLLAVPATIGNSVGDLLKYGIEFHFIPEMFSFLLQPTYIFGFILCVIEGVIDCFGLARQISFSNEFDFDLLKAFKILTENISVAEGQKAFTVLFNELKQNQESFEHLYGRDRLNFLSDFKKAIEQKPHFFKFILEQYYTQIKELAHVILAKNIFHLREKYLQLNPDEVKKITNFIENKYSKLSVEVQQAKLIKHLESEINKKRKSLARRVRPWMVYEATDAADSILAGLMDEDNQNQELALKHGFHLINDINIQNRKKKIAHIIGIIALIIAAISIIALIASAPYAVPFVLISIATIIATGRFLFFTGSLDVPGWNFSFQNFFPYFIRKRLWSDPLPSDNQNFQKRKMTLLLQPPIIPARTPCFSSSISPASGTARRSHTHFQRS